MIDQIYESLALWLPGVSIMFALTVASGFFSGSETAIFSLTRTNLQSFRNGSRAERQVVSLLGDPSRLLTAILFWNLVINLSYFAVSVVVTRRLIVAEYSEVGWLVSLLGVISIIVFGEVIPKSLSVVYSNTISRCVAFPLSVAVRILDRILPLLTLMTRGLQRGFWPRLIAESVIDADDLEKAVDLSTRSSEMIAHERQILHHILDLSEIAVEELMRPRGTYVTVPEQATWKDLGYRMPLGGFCAIVEEGTDQVIGTFWLQGSVYHEQKGLASYRESVEFVPWCANVARVLSLLRTKLCRVAVVVDEYGETLGVVTQQDILETVLSTSPSRARRVLRRDAVLKVEDQTYHIDGFTTLRFLAEHLGTDFDSEQESSVTVAGLFHQQLRRFPEVGDSIHWQGWMFRVIDVPGPGRVRVLLDTRVSIDGSDQGGSP